MTPSAVVDPDDVRKLDTIDLRIPIEGGAPCDRCGKRAFRKTQTGLHRHLDCEPAWWRHWQSDIRLGRQTRPEARRARSEGCRGCCTCRGRT